MYTRDTLSKEPPPAYEQDEGPLSAECLDWIREAARSMLPKGKVLSTRSLLENEPPRS
jgi:hypothetical protein